MEEAERRNGTYTALERQGVPVKYMISPDEGLSVWVSCPAPNKVATDLDKSYDLMDALLDLESGAFSV
jgi:hypothetical protein